VLATPSITGNAIFDALQDLYGDNRGAIDPQLDLFQRKQLHDESVQTFSTALKHLHAVAESHTPALRSTRDQTLIGLLARGLKDQSNIIVARQLERKTPGLNFEAYRRELLDTLTDTENYQQATPLKQQRPASQPQRYHQPTSRYNMPNPEQQQQQSHYQRFLRNNTQQQSYQQPPPRHDRQGPERHGQSYHQPPPRYNMQGPDRYEREQHQTPPDRYGQGRQQPSQQYNTQNPRYNQQQSFR
jgi:hypothetical protein